MRYEPSSKSLDPVFGQIRHDVINRRDLKRTLLLSTALFLMTAPAPDALVISEMTSNFIIPASSQDDVTPKSDT